MAEAGHPVAKRYVTAYAREIGQLVAASIAVLDPGLVVLGGGIGQNKLLLPDVCQVVNELHGETQVETTALGEDATLIGIARMATSHAQSILTGEISVGRSTDQSGLIIAVGLEMLKGRRIVCGTLHSHPAFQAYSALIFVSV